MKISNLIDRVNMLQGDQLPKHCRAVLFFEPGYKIPKALIDSRGIIVIPIDQEKELNLKGHFKTTGKKAPGRIPYKQI